MPSTTGGENTKIRAAVLEAPGKFSVQNVPRPALAAHEVLVRIAYTGICGSDFPIVDGIHPRATLPLVPGHEMAGIVEESGDGELPSGTVVAVNPLLSCGGCGACARGLPHICRNLRLLGIDAPGSMAELMAVPSASLFPLPAGTPLKEAVLAEPLAVAVHAIRRSRLVSGESALIFGAGPIGLLIGLVARHIGASVTLVEPNDRRREAVEALGMPAITPNAAPVARALRDDVADVVFDCAGHRTVTPLLTEATPVRGRIVIVAVHHGPSEVDLRELAFAEQEIIGVRVYERRDFSESVRLIGAGLLPVGAVPISEYPLESAMDAFSEARSGSGAVKVVIRS
ncbi:alcohol dehydrogenase catalytic domain-containing protein [Paenarthrobacter sp. MMS21-TAE1-1]|uniref:Alcohol dehydrogenase catalytic domain-containing protein n=1 Tax=Paenarthrobacter aromaticivorans TaxID=2849150 RepID=A0ABS6HZ99_9MICC|nr:alcohol dehydrogenase catalytic domain-containing protein [Paenarthrobacter sp. MMS21-TAE1-1]